MVFLRVVAISAGITLAIALGLILSQWPGPPAGGGLDFDRLQPSPGSEPEPWQARDGTELWVRRHMAGREGVPLVVVLHGSGGHGGSYDWLGASLADRGVADVLVPDLRGHGQRTAQRGDVAYIGQLEDDLRDLIAAHLKQGQKLVLLGHSSGGGLVIRAMGGGLAADGVVLVAPYLHHDAPTMRDNSGGWAHALTRRIIGLAMLNAVGVRWLNHLTAITFNVPDGWREMGMTDRYSFRMNTSYAPRRDWQGAVAELPPFLLIAGEADEAFKAEAYEPTLAPLNPGGQYRLLPGVTHLGVVTDPKLADLVAAYLEIL